MELSEDTSPSAHGTGEASNSPANSTFRDVANPTPSIETTVRSGATIIPPDAQPAVGLNPRSCVTCRRRKVRCDKHMPCGNCRKAHISCIFPAPGRAPRRPRPKDPNAPPKQTSEREVELMKRLRKLEGIVEELSGQIEVEARNPSNAGSPEDQTDNPHEKDTRRNASLSSSSIPQHGVTRSNTLPSTRWKPLANPASYNTKDMDSNFNRLTLRDNGRLLLHENGNTRYVSSAFWSKINDELDQLRAETQKLTDDDTDETDDDGSSPATGSVHTATELDHHSFILGYRSSDVDLRKLHPLPSQIPFIWQIYCENVDPMVKILHIPTMNDVIRKLRTNMDSISPSLEALMFSIYFATIVSLEDEEVKLNFNAERSDLIRRYRFGTEQALAKANFLTAPELEIVQAFTMYLLLARREDNTRFAWSLTGLLIRLSQMLGIHREGTHFSNLSPFEIEMRRRLWWAICVLDLRAAEDQGTELTIAERTYDTQFPMNINDADITPEIKTFPPERTGTTDMTFSLLRYEILSLARKMHAAASIMAPCPKDAQLSLKEREDLLLAMYERVDRRYIQPCAAKDSNLLQWMSALIARLILAKMSLVVYQPMLFPPPGQEVPQAVRDRLFLSSTEAVEYNKILFSEPKCKQYRWLFQVYTQWHVVAYILIEVCRRPWSGTAERAWMALNATFQSPDLAAMYRMTNTSAILIPIRKLMLKATRHREDEIARLRANPEAARELDEAEGNGPTPVGFHHLPSSLRNTAAHERWRKLVGRPTGANPLRPLQSTHSNLYSPSPSPALAPASIPVTESVSGLQQQAPDGTQTQLTQDQMNSLGNAMAQPWNPADFWTAAFQNGAASEIARQAVLGAPTDITSPFQINHSLPTTSTSSGQGGTVFARESPTAPVQSGEAQPVDLVDDNPPPWLWSNDLKWDEVDATANFPAGDGMDVNMDVDDDFNWHDWQQNFRGYDLDAIGMGNPGFSGGM